MKTSIYSILLIILIVSSCKKDKTISPDDEVNKPEFPEWVIYNTNNSKLIDNQINAISIDKYDVKWLGTANGLIRINAESWDLYNSANTALPSDYIRAIAISDHGIVWVGTDKGLVSFDGKKWVRFDTTNSILTSNSISCITYDQKKDIVWVGTDEGIVRIDKDGQWTYHYVNDLVISLTCDRDGYLWAGMFNPFSFTGKIKQFKEGKWISFILADIGYPSAWPYALATGDDNNLLVVLSGTSVKTLVRFNGSSWQEVPGPSDAYGLKSLLVDGSGFWVGGTGLSVFGSGRDKSITMPGISSVILAMARDKYGRKWLATLNDGLVVYTEKK